MLNATEQEILKLQNTLKTIEIMIEKTNPSKKFEEYEALNTSKWLMLNQINKLEKN